jgi:hypothetical protein
LNIASTIFIADAVVCLYSSCFFVSFLESGWILT